MDTPTFSSFENTSIAIGSAAQPLVLTCVYRPPGSCSESFLDTLLNSLSSWFGVSGVVLDWFKSYLSDHVQCIKIGSILSDAKKLLYGVPQGSVLGQSFFHSILLH